MMTSRGDLPILRQLKLGTVALALLVLFFIAVGFGLLSRQLPEVGSENWLSLSGLIHAVDWSEVCGTIFELLFIVFVFEIYLRSESERATQSLLFSDSVVEKILSLEKVKQVLAACLRRVIGDHDFARDLARMLQSDSLLPKVRKFDLHYDLTLSELPKDAPAQMRALFYKLQTKVAYRTQAQRGVLKFMLTNDRRAYTRAAADPEVEWKFLQHWPDDLSHYAEDWMKVVSCSVDGVAMTRNGRDSACQFTVPISGATGWSHIEYKVEVLVRKNSHYTAVHFDEAAFNPSISFDYSGVDFDYLNVMEAFTTVGVATFDWFPDGATPGDAHRVAVSVTQEWVIPKSSVAFIWRRKCEVINLPPEAI